jgi:hypothetical protein
LPCLAHVFEKLRVVFQEIISVLIAQLRHRDVCTGKFWQTASDVDGLVANIGIRGE